MSVCLSVKRVNCDKTKETCADILTRHETSFILVFSQEEWLVWTTPSTWNFGSNWPGWSENADFHSIFSRSATAVTPSEKSSIHTNKKSTTRFPMSLRWTSYIARKPPKGAKNAKQPFSRFPCKIALHLKKVWYKVSSCRGFLIHSWKIYVAEKHLRPCRLKLARRKNRQCRRPRLLRLYVRLNTYIWHSGLTSRPRHTLSCTRLPRLVREFHASTWMHYSIRGAFCLCSIPVTV